jgi:hypothetical protein
MTDPIVEEVRAARLAHAQSLNHDLAAICADLKRIERECGHQVISLPPRRLTTRAKGPSDAERPIAPARW